MFFSRHFPMWLFLLSWCSSFMLWLGCRYDGSFQREWLVIECWYIKASLNFSLLHCQDFSPSPSRTVPKMQPRPSNLIMQQVYLQRRANLFSRSAIKYISFYSVSDVWSYCYRLRHGDQQKQQLPDIPTVSYGTLQVKGTLTVSILWFVHRYKAITGFSALSTLHFYP